METIKDIKLAMIFSKTNILSISIRFVPSALNIPISFFLEVILKVITLIEVRIAITTNITLKPKKIKLMICDVCSILYIASDWIDFTPILYFSLLSVIIFEKLVVEVKLWYIIQTPINKRRRTPRQMNKLYGKNLENY